MKKEAKSAIHGTILIVAKARIARVYYTPLPESMRPIIGTNNQINKLLIRPGRGWGFVPVFHVSRCRAAPCCCAPSGSVPLWPHSTLGSQEAGARPDHGLVEGVLQVCKGWSLVIVL